MGIIYKLEQAKYNSKNKRIKRLEKEFRPGGTPWASTIYDGQQELAKNDARLERELHAELNDALGRVEKRYDSKIATLSTRVKVLEDIVRESGLITDYSSDEVKIREDHQVDRNGNAWGSHQVAYQINQVKTV